MSSWHSKTTSVSKQKKQKSQRNSFSIFMCVERSILQHNFIAKKKTRQCLYRIINYYT